MRKLSEVLAIARAHIAGGWHPTVSVDSSGAVCTPDDEGVDRFSILDAVDLAAHGEHELLLRAMRALGRRLSPVKPPEWERARGAREETGLLGDWEADPKRTQAHVLQLFTRAYFTAVAEENR